MTPTEVLEALRAHEFDRVRSIATPGFRKDISSEEMQRVWGEMEAALGPIRSIGPNVVVHDLALHCEKGDAHLQVAFADGTLSGLVLLEGAPTGRFGR